MRTGFLSLVTSVALMFSVSFAEWLEWGAGCPEGDSPLVRHNTTQTQYISFDVELHGLLADSVEYDSDYYWRFTGSPGARTAHSVGYPELPVVTCFVIVPDDTDLDLQYMASCDESVEGLTIYPAPMDSLVFDDGAHFEEFFRKDSAAYASTEWYPETLAVLSGEFMLRDQRVAIVDVYPVQFLASEDSLRVWCDIEVMVGFDEIDPDWSDEDLGPYEQMIGNTLIGYRPTYTAPAITTGSVAWHEDLSQDPPLDPDYMIIVAHGLADTQDEEDVIEDFAEYRAALNGFDVLITRTDDIYDEYHQTGFPYLLSNHIRDYTEDVWEYCEGDRPSYLLLIGDHEGGACYLTTDWFLPTRSVTCEFGDAPYSGYGNDEWYVYFDESLDVGAAFPDMIVGRLPARDPETLEDMLLLIEDYEEEITGTPPSNVQYRRYLTRLAGTDNDGQSTEDIWEPSPDWTEGLKDWMGYSWDNYYCGDANDQTSSDGSTMSSDDWVDACNTVFERGSHVAFYSDHGDFHMFSAGLDWSEGGPDNFGTPDSTFDDIDVQQLASETHWHPFVLMFCCSAGTFDHMESDHDHGNAFECLCHADTPEPYDFGSDCLAEEFVLNTECGAIGVFASSGPSGTSLYGPMGMAMLKAIYYRGISRLGDVIQAGRLESLDDFWDGEEWLKDLGQFNLLGDPALDIGDRMKYRGIYCDLVVSPEDLEIAAYPTVPAGSSTGTMDLQVTTRNIGWYASSACDAELEVVWNSAISILEARCPALDPGESTALSFEWTIPDGIEINDEIELTAAVDTEDDCTESWEVNNEATGVVYYQGGFPNDDGWPVRLTGSIYSPPILADLDLDGDMEIIAINGWMISAISSDDQSVLWSAGPYHFQKDIANQGYSVAAVGDVTGDAHPEIVFDTRYRLVVLSYTGVEIDTFEHGRLLGTIVFGPHGVTLADIFASSGKLEIAVVCPEDDEDPLSLFILNVQNSTITELDQEELTGSSNPFEREWVCAYDLTEDDSDELILSYSRKGSTAYESGLWIYDHIEETTTSQFIDYETWSDGSTWKAGIQAIGRLTGSTDQIALSMQRSQSGVHTPASVFESDDLSESPVTCDAATAASSWILCCLMTDWSNVDAGLDHVIAPAENQCLVWDDEGDLDGDWDDEYEVTSTPKYPPFPALANLVVDSGYEYPELIIGTRTGWVNALDRDNHEISTLGFPYYLPSEIYGGFVVADIDEDEKLEVVFGTMDNYLHVWELDDCDEGYAPWPQCQRDASRTGTLMEE